MIKNNNHITFGTDGIRGIVNKFPFTNNGLLYIGSAIIQWAKKHFNKNDISIVIGYDTRESALSIKKSIARGLAGHNVTLFDAGIVPTPAICYSVFGLKTYDLGIVISASHNPYYYNGIKIFTSDMCKLSVEDETAICAIFEILKDETSKKLLGVKNKLIMTTCNVANVYKKMLLDSAGDLSLNGLVIALDTANGALYSIAIDVFHALGAKLVFSDSLPNGTNINDHCGSVYPNVLASVLKKYSIIKAGFAFDGDGDRIVAINSNGDIKDGDDILSLLLQLPIYKNQKGIVGTIISNGGLEQYIKNIGKEFIRVSVGDKYVAKALKTTQFILGGEPSGHVILNDHLPISDGLFIAIKVLHSIMLNNNWEMKTFDKMIQINATIPIKYKADLSKSPFIDSIKKQEARIPLGKIIVRYSGTENVLRILVEDLDTILAQSVTNDLITEISTLFTQSLINDVNNATYHTNTGESPYELSA